MADTKKPEGLVYKNHPLRRVDNFIYYGSMADKYIVLLQILDTVKEKDMDVAKRVSVQLQLTDPDLKSRDRVVKKSEKDSLYAAMDVGCIWLERALAGKLSVCAYEKAIFCAGYRSCLPAGHRRGRRADRRCQCQHSERTPGHSSDGGCRPVAADRPHPLPRCGAAVRHGGRGGACHPGERRDGRGRGGEQRRRFLSL